MRRGLRLFRHDVDFELDDFWLDVRDGAYVDAGIITRHLVDDQNFSDRVAVLLVDDRRVLEVIFLEHVAASDLQDFRVFGLVVHVSEAPHKLKRSKNIYSYNLINVDGKIYLEKFTSSKKVLS